MSFHVLDRTVNVQQSHLLEASAGTGKTYSIENIVVRLLIETDASLEQILVVTFTRAATRELRHRIRSNISKVLESLQCENEDLPDYLKAVCKIKAKRALEEALFSFDQAQIFTIHGFCSRMLREHGFECALGFNVPTDCEPMPRSKIMEVIRDFFRTGVRAEHYSVGQLKQVLKKYNKEAERLQEALYKTITGNVDVAPMPDFKEHLLHFKQTMHKLRYPSILEDFLTYSKEYKAICNKQGEVLPENLKLVQRFASLFEGNEDFDILIEDGIVLLDFFHPENLKAKGKPISTEFTNFLDALRKELLPIVEKARSPMAIFARMAYDCQRLFKKVSVEEEMPILDDLLKGMDAGLNNADFLQAVQKKYRAAIIDEFQDTDAIQWDIFRKVFIESKEHILYLVGDPKQSIYGFRQADIYTYLTAAQSITNKASLDTNYRSQPALVQALNTLFSCAPGWIGLPKSGSELHYKPVKFATKSEPGLKDAYGAIHFMIGEEFLPFIAQEIHRLNKTIPYNQCAILVRNRFQAAQVAEFLKKQEIPAALQHEANLADSSAVPIMRSLLAAVLNPRDFSAVKLMLAGRLFQWDHERIRMLTEDPEFEKLLVKLYSLRKVLFKDSFAAFFQQVMNDSILEHLLQQDGGSAFFADMQHLAECLTEHQMQAHASPDGLIQFIDRLPLLKEDQNENLKVRRDPNEQAVPILTMHMSKGLEFEVVFALGLLKRDTERDELIPYSISGRPYLVPPIQDYQEARSLHKQEIDAEKMRLLYVAMTRAKQRLYLPVLIKEELASPGCASPMELFLEKLGKPIEQFIDQHNNTSEMTYSYMEQAPIEKLSRKSLQTIPLVAPHVFPVPGFPSMITSFSSLAKEEGDVPQGTPHDRHAEEKTVHTLPAGSETGNVLHQILEKLPFNSTLHQIRSHVGAYLESHPLKEWEEVVVRMLEQTLAVRLHDDFRVCDIKECYREMEFLYPYTGQSFDLPEGVQLENHMVKGYIDLIFRDRGKYYILDWKSNWLGPTRNEYSEEHLARAMKSHSYTLQASLYVEALRRYLKIVEPRSFDSCFGGIYYLFLRGVDSTENGQQGIFSIH